MEKFKIQTNQYKEQTINRTIRLKLDVYDKIMELSEKNNISANKVINQCLEYALKNLEEEA